MTRRWRLAKRVIARRVHGRMIVVRVPSLEARVLNEMGARVWELLGGRTSAEIVAIIRSELDVPEAELARDVVAFLADLEADALIDAHG